MKIKLTFFIIIFTGLMSCNNKLKGLYCSEIYHTNICILFSKSKKFHYSEFGDQTTQEGYGSFQIKDKELILSFKEKIPCTDCLHLKKLKLLKDSVFLRISNLGLHKRFTLDIDIPSIPYGINERIEQKEYQVRVPFKEKGSVRIREYGFPSIEFELTEPGEYEVQFQFENRLEFQIPDTERTYNILKKDKQEMLIEWQGNEMWKWNLKKDFESTGYKYWKPHFRVPLNE